jgi:hypothetical protein
MLAQQPVHERPVADVATDEDVGRVALERLQALEIACVGELVQVHHRAALGVGPLEDEVGADEAGGAGDECRGHGFRRSRPRKTRRPGANADGDGPGTAPSSAA